jgi:hypothetical protein
LFRRYLRQVGCVLNVMSRYRGSSGGLAAFVAFLALAVSCSTASATFPGANGRIAFERGGIYTISPDGSGLRRLVASGEDPAWSPGGGRIVFSRPSPEARWVYVMRADGSQVRRIPHAQGYDASFAPNGHRIVFISGRDFSISSIRTDGTGYRRLGYGRSPEYSPDGNHIVYELSGISSMRSDGSHKRVLFENPRVHEPSYRTDGRRIIFGECVGDCGHDYSLPWVMHPNGSHIQPFSSGPDCAGRSPNIAPVYSPDGAFIAYSQWDPPTDPMVSNIWIARTSPPCASAHAVTPYEPKYGESGAFAPSWQPRPAR